VKYVNIIFCFLAPNFVLIGQYGAEIRPKTIFKMASVRRIRFAVTSSHCIREHFYVSNTVLNLQVSWFSTF